MKEGNIMKNLLLIFLVGFSMSVAKEKVIQIITGSTREGRSSLKFANLVKDLLADVKNKKVEIVDIKDFNIPFLYESVAPSRTQERKDPNIAKWSSKIKEADAFVFIVPEYNKSFPAVLKNAIDVLYQEWNNKSVFFVGYSGGSSGASFAIKHLKDVCDEIKLKFKGEVNIPSAWKAFDEKGELADKSLKKQFSDSLLKFIKSL